MLGEENCFVLSNTTTGRNNRYLMPEGALRAAWSEGQKDQSPGAIEALVP